MENGDENKMFSGSS